MTRPGFENVVRTIVRTIGEILITCGLVVLLFAGYEVWGKTAETQGHQNTLSNQIDQAWGASPQGSSSPASAPQPAGANPFPGSAIARIYIQKMRKDPWVVVQGIKPYDIRYAPGHYPQSQMPGEIGNFAVAGHRTPGIWWDLDRVRSGDIVVVETKDNWYVYKVYQNQIVKPNAIEVIAPVPGSPGATPTKALITLTTCNPKFDNYERMVIHGELDRVQPKIAGKADKPAELG
jgi:sortase A